MRQYDYTLEFYLKGKKTRTYTYQGLIEKLELTDEIVHGQPMRAGGAPQALSLKATLEKAMPDTEIHVLHNGSRVF
jgi:hypothetical protein